MKKQKNITQDGKNVSGKRGKGMWIFLYIIAFIGAFGVGAASKMKQPSWTKDYTVVWNDSVGTMHEDLSYSERESNKFDL